MESLARQIRSFRHRLGNNRSATVLTVAVILLASIELAGRHTTTDWHDLVVAAVFGAVLLGLAHQHQRSPLPWLRPVSQALRAAGNWLKQWLVEVGYDLRGEPAVKRGIPPLVVWLAAMFLGLGAVLLAFGDNFP